MTPEKAIKLAVNDMARRVLANKYNSGNAHDLPAHLGMFAGALAGFCQVVATNPMEMVKIQMQVASQYFNGLFRKSTMLVVRELGLRGIYRGSLATLSRDVPFSIIFFQSSAAFKNVFGGDSPTLFSIFASGLLAGCLAATAVTPMDVIKTRLQVQGGISHKSNFHYRGILDCFQ